MAVIDTSGLKQRYTSPEEQKVIDAVKNIKSNDNENDFMTIQATAFEFQRQSGSSEEFDKYLYDKLNAASKNVDGLLEYYTELVKRVQYIKDVMDSLKATQEMSDGYSEYNRKKYDIDTSGLGLFNAGVSNITLNMGNQSVGTVQSINTADTIINSILDKIKKSSAVKG